MPGMAIDPLRMSEQDLARLEAASEGLSTPCGAGHMAWRRWGGGSERLAAVLLHGGAGSWRHWVRNIDALSQQRVVLAGDIPGLGASDLPPSGDHHVVADVIADGVERLCGSSPCHLVGFSFGGLLAGMVATRIPRRVASLTIVGSGSLGLPRSPTPLEKVSGKTGADRLAAHRANLASLMIADAQKIDALAIAIQDWNTRHARLRRRPSPETAPLRDALAATRVRLNAIYGERDATAYPNVAQRERLMRRLHPELRFEMVAGGGHWIAYEAPCLVNRWLDEWLT